LKQFGWENGATKIFLLHPLRVGRWKETTDCKLLAATPLPLPFPVCSIVPAYVYFLIKFLGQKSLTFG
jgi:hypothetical protein